LFPGKKHRSDFAVPQIAVDGSVEIEEIEVDLEEEDEKTSWCEETKAD